MDEMVKGATTGSLDLSALTSTFTGAASTLLKLAQSLGLHNYIPTSFFLLSPSYVGNNLVDTVHIWGPLLTLFVFLFFGPGAGVAANGVGNRVAGAGNNGVGNRAWLAFSAAVTIRQLVLWFFNIPPIRACVKAIGIEIVPTNRGRRNTSSNGRGGGRSGGNRSRAMHGGVTNGHGGAAPHGSARHCLASKYEAVANVPTAFSRSEEIHLLLFFFCVWNRPLLLLLSLCLSCSFSVSRPLFQRTLSTLPPPPPPPPTQHPPHP
jgi:hypothetical protein